MDVPPPLGVLVIVKVVFGKHVHAEVADPTMQATAENLRTVLGVIAETFVDSESPSASLRAQAERLVGFTVPAEVEGPFEIEEDDEDD